MLTEMAKAARLAARTLALASSEQKNQALHSLAAALETNSSTILAANQQDWQAARDSGLSDAMLDRLMLNPARLAAIVADLRRVAELPDPVGERFDQTRLPNGLLACKQRVPLGVLGVIYEARPNVTVDVAGLAIKTGNVALLRGGSETLASNRALVAAIQNGLQQAGLPGTAIQFIDDPDRKRVLELLQLHNDIDLIIPRGGAALHEFCRQNSRIPVITGGIGICHLFVDASANLEAALAVIHNAKVQRPTVCNALDTVLVHHQVAAEFLPRLVSTLEKDGVTFRADPAALAYFYETWTGVYIDEQGQLHYGTQVDPHLPGSVQPAGEQDFDTEWLSLVLSIQVVQDLDEAIAHIQTHSTAHSDGILTEDEAHARRFIAEVDSAAVYVNASTRFTDGAQLGLGAEVAISTQRLHARGPMGLRELTTYKWVLQGNYHVRA